MYRLDRQIVVRRGTAREAAEHATGYTPNGLSQHTRVVAHGGKEKRERGQWRSRPELIEKYKHEIAVLRRRIGMENDRERLTKLVKDLQIKNHLLLRAMRGEART
jgi:hypothetical protein